ncbi:hypothetical protein Rsub_04090 [Raphidocelis subcapitata]|uniref:Uncharacterized protein n=1 Tax=Raphidocelis subcapitata TaxID=307507 RepID=A0A2V0P0I6_9CHLO|nr:hypothetical protein Rsub_04090 [Raphidocelis subcapitata]|eukprot:GBF91350.1 hypothetical protein Rsub_04090 [Raphidocelis subcapitata]
MLLRPGSAPFCGVGSHRGVRACRGHAVAPPLGTRQRARLPGCCAAGTGDSLQQPRPPRRVAGGSGSGRGGRRFERRDEGEAPVPQEPIQPRLLTTIIKEAASIDHLARITDA